MPIRKELRHLYRGPAWLATRAKILQRCNNRCEQCGAVKGTEYLNPKTGRTVVVQLGVAHRDHEDLERFFDDDNLLCLCRKCHLKFDAPVHQRSRETHKDQARPLLEAIA
jgi:hypothetical protein